MAAEPPSPPPLVDGDEAQRLPPETETEVLGPAVTARAPRAPTSRFGVIGIAGGEGLIPVNGAPGSLGVRAGGGVRFALQPRTDDEETVNTTPSVGLVAGYAGPVDHRVFVELRTELTAGPGGGLFLPGFTVYALSGLDTLLSGGGVDPYVGMGIGWDYNIFKKNDSAPAPPPPKGGWLGGGLGGGGLGQGLGVLIAGAVVVAAVIGFVCVGRVEIRYHPSPPLHAPPNVSVMIGYGL